MSNNEKMAYWKGGDSSEVLRFTNPYDYEDCIIGVSTDGRAVYDFMKVMEYIYDIEKDNYDLNDFENEDDLRYTIMSQAADMINHDLSCYNPDDKIPVFCRTDLDVEEDDTYLINEEYSFGTNCVLGPDFREDRYIFSLSEIVNELIKLEHFDKEEAVRYVYSLKKAGTVESGVYNYVIVDDLYENISINPNQYTEYNAEYTGDPKSICFEISGKNFIESFGKLDYVFPNFNLPQEMLNYYQVRKNPDNNSEIQIDCTDARFFARSSAKPTSINIEGDLLIPYKLVRFVLSKISESDFITVSVDNDYLFIKTTDELYGHYLKPLKYPNTDRIIPSGCPYSAEINISTLRSFITDMEDNNQGIKITFANQKVKYESDEAENSADSVYNCPENFSFMLYYKYCKILTEMLTNDKITINFEDSQKALLIDVENLKIVCMPIKQ